MYVCRKVYFFFLLTEGGLVLIKAHAYADISSDTAEKMCGDLKELWSGEWSGVSGGD